MKKMTAILLVLLFLLSAYSCAKTGNKEKETVLLTDAPEETADPRTVPPVIPDDVKGNGSTMLIQVEGWAFFSLLDVLDVAVEEDTGEPINVAAYNRDRRVEQALDVKIESDVYPDCDSSMAAIRKLISSGDSDIDLWLMRSAGFTTAIGEEMLNDIGSGEFGIFDPDKIWWDRNSYDSFSIADYHYGITGDFTTADDLTYWCVFFNKDMIKDYQLESPYDIVRDGGWTFDKMYELAKVAAGDVNGNDPQSYDGQHGISMIRDVLAGSMNTSGITLMEKDDDDYPEFTFYTEDNVDKFLHLLEIFYDKEVVYNCHVQGGDEINIFTNGKTLFTLGGVYYGPSMRNTETDFGMLPMPKYDESQTYISATSPLFLSILTVPKNNTDNNALRGAFMELYSCMGRELIIPEFYDRLLDYKVARDDDSREMLDYIFGNTVYDIGGIFNLSNISFTLVDMMYTYNRNIASVWEANESKTEEALEKLLSKLF